MLVNAQDSEGESSERMTDEQVRDEVLIMIVAGHETTATSFSWIWFLLSQNPEVEKKLHAELDEVLSNKRLPTAEDFPRLQYTRQVAKEALRIRPPVWTIARRCITPCEIGDYEVSPGTIMLLSQWLLHHDPRCFDAPLEFRPERWTQNFEASLPNTSYFPFGAGIRRCVGENFAIMEIVIVLATIAHRWRLRVNDPARVVPQPLFTLRLKNGLPVTLERR